MEQRHERLRHQPALDGLAAYRVGIDALAVVGQGDHHFAAFAGELQADVAALLLAGATALLRVLDAVVHGVAQHMLQRRHHALQGLDDMCAGSALEALVIHCQLRFLLEDRPGDRDAVAAAVRRAGVPPLPARDILEASAGFPEAGMFLGMFRTACEMAEEAAESTAAAEPTSEPAAEPIAEQGV